MPRRLPVLCLSAYLLALANGGWTTGDLASRVWAQTATPVASPQPTPLPQQQESVKIYTKEVLLPVVATDSSGRFDPTLELNDLLVLEVVSRRVGLHVRPGAATWLLASSNK